MAINALYPLGPTTVLSCGTGGANVAITNPTSVTNLWCVNDGAHDVYMTWNFTGPATPSTTGVPIPSNSGVIVQVGNPNGYDNTLDIAGIRLTGTDYLSVTPVA